MNKATRTADERFLAGGLWRYACVHEHINGRRCGTRVAAMGSYCQAHLQLPVCDHCHECHQMAEAFGLELHK